MKCNHDIHSPKIQKLLGDIPATLVRTGYIILTIVILILLFVYLVIF